MYLISTFELSKLNFIFRCDEQKDNKNQEEHNQIYIKNSYDIEKKILSYSENIIYSYKTLLQHMSNPKENKIDGISLKIFIIYINLSLILNLIKKGNYILGFTNLKNLLNNENLICSANKEIIDMIMNILIELLEYDIDSIL